MSMRKGLRVAVAAGVAVLGLGVMGAPSASAMPDPAPGGGYQVSPYRDPWPQEVQGPVRVTPLTKSVTASALRVRSGPGTDRRVHGLVFAGDRVEVLNQARNGGPYMWSHVKITRSSGDLPRGYVGWVADTYLD
ncbi:SH3 domain-containing protein [Streptomyces sp. NPDC050485]|uniref:SH3 domain-containing protein n=1 Tax=Streptomyces sp. NPDC050485 TaxID=3365617 RepID=UPI003792F851